MIVHWILVVVLTVQNALSLEETVKAGKPEAEKLAKEGVKEGRAAASGRLAQDQGEAESGMGTEIPTFEDCGEDVVVRDQDNSIYFMNSSFNQATSKHYPPEKECAWVFAGDPLCTVEFSCSELDLHRNTESEESECTSDEEHIEVSDGVGGQELFCGKKKFSKRVASNGLQDLYIKFRATKKAGAVRRGFKCTLVCSKDPSTAKALKIVKKRQENENCVCGIKPKKRTKRIVTGFGVGLNEWPWQVAIVKPRSRTSFCGGAILNSRFILTAAHCSFFERLKPDQVEILLHARQLDRTDRKELKERVPDPSVIEVYKEKLRKTAEKLSSGLKNLTGNLNKPSLAPVQGAGSAITNATTDLKKPDLEGSVKGTGLKNVTKDVPLKDVPLKAAKLKNVTDIKNAKLDTPTSDVGGKEVKGLLSGVGRRRRAAAKTPVDPSLVTGLGKNTTKSDEYSVTVVQNLSDVDERTRRYKVKRIINHPLFTQAYDFDVSLIEIEGEIELGMTSKDDHTAVCLPPLGYAESFVSHEASVVGWGLKREEDNYTDGTLHQLSVEVMDNKVCQNWTEYEITPRMMCAGYEDGLKDACVGDSGGPLNSMNDKSQWMQIGIVSWGEGCAKARKPGMYARVTQLQQWVLYHTLRKGKWCKNDIA